MRVEPYDELSPTMRTTPCSVRSESAAISNVSSIAHAPGNRRHDWPSTGPEDERSSLKENRRLGDESSESTAASPNLLSSCLYFLV